ncbi:hypothetical protein AJ85_13365 [Alkalihalobacillus alcalophilus ATCC 27647 = CGMCC 1.3604]|uniref:Probable membrane transporter protein n=1 Tax=Alkalihalobacillus alcalophilus ATCC 27647 = CGMCC 1.3604 TaxID=1218173 RepID=A0A094WN60_ALKAL|nr:sulfite exporter TauE/SafE family protein [Alkalihalobacillus alcalophilus]KGA99189.1 hypothetical protein BALCAV_0200620 [Alkalihalobacillus alcalophilus ATCC 27647 = CGMCC 1.3604]MED1561268.1 sulfite exporter TauE/SafE family protein [Alkalihalobacillus alcalophilus]THG90104.1 hypothetical protein AJ85_13365 [Alkalihalobacillus alcalophilus ATCC 27647 = CGMCC 1.3604]
MFELLMIFMIVFVGSFIQGVSGFGFGLIAMGLLPYLFTLKDSTLLVMALTVFLTLRILISHYRALDLKGLMLILMAAIVGRVGGFFVLTNFGELDILKSWLGFVLLAMVVYMLLNKKPQKVNQQPSKILTVTLGVVGGFVGGVFAVGGPFFVFYFLMVYADKLKYNANLQAVFFVTSILTVTAHGFNGDFHSSFFVYFAVGLVAVLLGVSLGIRSFSKLPANTIRYVAMIIVACSALNLMFFS